MSRRNLRPPRAASEEVVPRSGRPDPRSDPDEAGVRAPMRHSGQVPTTRGSDAHRIAQVNAADLAAALAKSERLAEKVAQLEHALADRSDVEAMHADRVIALEEQNRTVLARAARAEQRVASLQAELTRKHESEAMLEMLADGQITDKEATRAHTEEIQALRLAVECARAENMALQERLADEHAQKERLLGEVARIQALLHDVRKLAR